MRRRSGVRLKLITPTMVCLHLWHSNWIVHSRTKHVLSAALVRITKMGLPSGASKPWPSGRVPVYSVPHCTGQQKHQSLCSILRSNTQHGCSATFRSSTLAYARMKFGPSGGTHTKTLDVPTFLVAWSTSWNPNSRMGRRFQNGSHGLAWECSWGFRRNTLLLCPLCTMFTWARSPCSIMSSSTIALRLWSPCHKVHPWPANGRAF